MTISSRFQGVKREEDDEQERMIKMEPLPQESEQQQKVNVQESKGSKKESTPSQRIFTTPPSSSSFLQKGSPRIKGEVRLREKGLGFDGNSDATDGKAL